MRMEAKLIQLQFAFDLPRFFTHTLLTNYFFTEAYSLTGIASPLWLPCTFREAEFGWNVKKEKYPYSPYKTDKEIGKTDFRTQPRMTMFHHNLFPFN